MCALFFEFGPFTTLQPSDGSATFLMPFLKIFATLGTFTMLNPFLATLGTFTM